MIETFQKYDAAGLLCLPCKADKSPNIRGSWLGGIVDHEAYRNSPAIGIICGKGSGGLEVIDVDNKFSDAKELVSEYARIPEVKVIFDKYPFVVQATQSGGYHLIYKCRSLSGNLKLASRPKKEGDRWKPVAIFETRSEGGYFCAAPSPGYKVIRGDITLIPEVSPEEREILHSHARSFNTWNETRKNEFEEADRPGDVYNQKPEADDEARAALLDAGWEEISPGSWRRPGKKRGISATMGRVAPGVFYNFSSNGHPFQENSGYTPFQVVGLLKYNGDFKTLAKDLADRYELQGKGPKSGSYDNSGNGESLDRRKKKTIQEYEQILTRSFIDLSIPVQKPPVVIMIRDYEVTRSVDKRLFTLGNFSAITGKSKSKKTFLSSLLLAAAAGNTWIQNKIIAEFPENKRAVLLFDTEQSRYDSYTTAARIPKILDYIPENFGCFDLREFSPQERVDIIEYALKKWGDNIGLAVIDGIADLATAINDEEIASKIVSLLLRWTKVYNCHICTVIHQNKNDNFATGHLGSAILKKAEVIISVAKNEEDYRRSTVKCDMIRGASDFKEFTFRVNDEGLPEVEKPDIKPIHDYTEPVRDEF